MDNIKIKYQEAREALFERGSATFFSNSCKDLREWHILGSAQRLLLDAGYSAPVLACKSEAPDFYTYSADGETLWAPVEIVDVHRPGYRLHEFHKRASLPDAPLFETYEGRLVVEQPWRPLRNRITAKAQKTYPRGTCLFVYYNIMCLHLPDMDTPFEQQLLAENENNPFSDMSKFGRVLLLDSRMGCLIQLHPTTSVFVPDLR